MQPRRRGGFLPSCAGSGGARDVHGCKPGQGWALDDQFFDGWERQGWHSGKRGGVGVAPAGADAVRGLSPRPFPPLRRAAPLPFSFPSLLSPLAGPPVQAWPWQSRRPGGEPPFYSVCVCVCAARMAGCACWGRSVPKKEGSEGSGRAPAGTAPFPSKRARPPFFQCSPFFRHPPAPAPAPPPPPPPPGGLAVCFAHALGRVDARVWPPPRRPGRAEEGRPANSGQGGSPRRRAHLRFFRRPHTGPTTPWRPR